MLVTFLPSFCCRINENTGNSGKWNLACWPKYLFTEHNLEGVTTPEEVLLMHIKSKNSISLEKRLCLPAGFGTWQTSLSQILTEECVRLPAKSNETLKPSGIYKAIRKSLSLPSERLGCCLVLHAIIFGKIFFCKWWEVSSYSYCLLLTLGDCSYAQNTTYLS